MSKVEICENSMNNLDILKELVKCVICKNTLYKPVTLDCQHSFCKSCIINVTTKECPMCRDYYLVLPSHYNNLLDDLSSKIDETNYRESGEDSELRMKRYNDREEIRNEIRNETIDNLTIPNNAFSEISRNLHEVTRTLSADAYYGRIKLLYIAILIEFSFRAYTWYTDPTGGFIKIFKSVWLAATFLFVALCSSFMILVSICRLNSNTIRRMDIDHDL